MKMIVLSVVDSEPRLTDRGRPEATRGEHTLGSLPDNIRVCLERNECGEAIKCPVCKDDHFFPQGEDRLMEHFMSVGRAGLKERLRVQNNRKPSLGHAKPLRDFPQRDRRVRQHEVKDRLMPD